MLATGLGKNNKIEKESCCPSWFCATLHKISLQPNVPLE